jgi:predicted small lipoprotein YifL
MRFCWAQYLLWLVISMLAISSMLTACGRKGDLYLPDKPASQQIEQSEQKK